MGIGVWELGFGVLGLGFRVWGLGYRVWGSGFLVSGVGFRVSCFGRRVSSSGFEERCVVHRAEGVGTAPFTEMCSGSDAGSYSRLIDFCITQL